jgi:hypothetical protein
MNTTIAAMPVPMVIPMVPVVAMPVVVATVPEPILNWPFGFGSAAVAELITWLLGHFSSTP